MENGTSGTFTSVVGYTSPYTLDSILITSGITSGTTYGFKYRVENIYGWSAFSQIAYIQASTTPSAPGTPSTSS